MEPYISVSQEDGYQISLDPSTHVLAFTGSFFPEDTEKFYSGIFEWLNAYESHLNETGSADPVICEFKLSYINSASLLTIKLICERIIAITKQSNSGIMINWHYLEEDEDMESIAEDLQELLNVPFHLHPIE